MVGLVAPTQRECGSITSTAIGRAGKGHITEYPFTPAGKAQFLLGIKGHKVIQK